MLSSFLSSLLTPSLTSSFSFSYAFTFSCPPPCQTPTAPSPASTAPPSPCCRLTPEQPQNLDLDLDRAPCSNRVSPAVSFNKHPPPAALNLTFARAPSFPPPRKRKRNSKSNNQEPKQEQAQEPYSPIMDSSELLSAPPSSAPSSPLSSLSKTPSLPSSPDMPDPTNRYPSPSSTAGSGSQSPIKLGEPIFSEEAIRAKLDAAAAAAADGPPPAKRRRITPPKEVKERTTEYLDLTKPDNELTPDENRQLDRLMTALRKKKKIVVIAGAGISVSAGIPDFRSSNGMFATAKNQHKVKGSGKFLFDASVYKHDSSTESFHAMVRQMAEMSKNAEPTPFHHLLASLAQEGRLMRLYSQNIDCLDTSMKPLATNVPLNSKGPWPATIQLHGGLEKMVCTKCGQLEPFDGNVFDGPEAPLCRACEEDDAVRTAHAGKRSHGIGRLRPRFVLYNEYNPDEEAIGNVSSADLKTRPDAVIVVGTTLKVPGTRRLVRELCQVTRSRKNGLTVWINVDPEPKGVDFRDCWDIVVKSKCDNVAKLAALPPWDLPINSNYLVSQEEHLQSQERRSKTTFAVNIPSSPQHAEMGSLLASRPKQVERMQGIPTPSASPKMSAAKRPAKAKQSKIPLAGGKDANPKKSAKATKTTTKAVKPRARKAKQATKATPTVQNIFKSSKANQPNEKKTIAIVPESNISELPALRPKQMSSEENFDFKCENKVEDASVCPPSTPITTKRKYPETISPPSLTSINLRKIVDLQ